MCRLLHSLGVEYATRSACHRGPVHSLKCHVNFHLRNAWSGARSDGLSPASTGQLLCPTCSRPAVDYHTLAQHMKDKHGDEPPARGPVTVSLSDLLTATRYPRLSLPAWLVVRIDRTDG